MRRTTVAPKLLLEHLRLIAAERASPMASLIGTLSKRGLARDGRARGVSAWALPATWTFRNARRPSGHFRVSR